MWSQKSNWKGNYTVATLWMPIRSGLEASKRPISSEDLGQLGLNAPESFANSA